MPLRIRARRSEVREKKKELWDLETGSEDTWNRSLASLLKALVQMDLCRREAGQGKSRTDTGQRNAHLIKETGQPGHHFDLQAAKQWGLSFQRAAPITRIFYE